MNANVEGRWPKGKEAGIRKGRKGRMSASRCVWPGRSAGCGPFFLSRGRCAWRITVPSSELRTGDVGTCLQILRDYWSWRKLLGLDGTFSEPKDVVLGFTESKESSDCKYFMRSEGCVAKTLGHSRVVWLIVTFCHSYWLWCLPPKSLASKPGSFVFSSLYLQYLARGLAGDGCLIMICWTDLD